jgi:hypothetical protein
MDVALQDVELSRVRDDEWVHFGDVLQLGHMETGGVLACDVEVKVTRLQPSVLYMPEVPEAEGPLCS